MKAFLPHQPVTNTGLRASQELLEVLQIALRSQIDLQAQISDIGNSITGSGLGYAGFYVTDDGDLVVSFSGPVPGIAINADGDLTITHTAAPPPMSIDDTGSVILEI